MSKPLSLNRKMIKVAVEKIRAGNPLSTVAAFLGVHRDTLRSWLKRGKVEETGLCRDLWLGVRKALAEFEEEQIGRIAKDDDWKAAKYLLESRIPWNWRPRPEINGLTVQPVLPVMADAPADRVAEAYELLSKIIGPGRDSEEEVLSSPDVGHSEGPSQPSA